MAILSQLSWLSGGFFLGLLCMYSIQPTTYNNGLAQQQFQHASLRHLVPRATSDDDILKFGNPGPVVDLLERTAYTTSFDRSRRIPYWSGEHLTKDSLVAGPNVTRDKSTFKSDSSVPAMFRINTKDYTNSGFDRGHQAPAADAERTQDALDETFLLTNIAPQVGEGFNRNYWAYLEAFCRDLTQNFTDVYLFTGPLFLPQNNNGKFQMTYELIGNGTIAVPTHFFKVLLVPKSTDYALASFILPNQAIDSKTDLNSFSVDLTNIETASGLQFFEKLDRTKFLKLCDLVTCKV